MMQRLLLLLVLLMIALPAHSAPQFTVTGVNTGFPASAANPLPVSVTSGATAANVNIQQGAANLSATNGIFTNVLQGNAALSATNGLFNNILQGNAVLSATNGLFSNILQGNAVVSATNPLFTTGGGVATANITNSTANIANSNTTITLVAASRHLVIKTSPSSAIIYVDLAGGAATTADFQIDPGGSLSVDLGAGISSYQYIGATATGTISTVAY